jgi:beta-lactamase regulating signal transducer with metallopeptidase domain
MEAIFLKLLNMSITASWLVFAVFLLRILFRKAPKFVSMLLWALVGIRLVCPFSLKSVLSVIPNPEPVPSEILTAEHPVIQSGISAVNETMNPVLSETFAPSAETGASPLGSLAFIASVLWLCGIVVLLLYTAVSYRRIHKSVREAALYQGNVWLCDRIDTPFILGVLRPRVFLPSDIEKADLPYVLAHEQAHLKRRDHLWKPLGFLLLTVYWFNPVLWVAYILFCKDMELACDERVLRTLGAACKKPYSNALINCSVPRKRISACPLAFGETGVKERVRSVLNYKKPAFWLAAVAVVAVAVAALVFLTNPETENVQTLADITQASALFDNVETLKLVEEKGETTAPAAQTRAILSDLQATEISVDPVSGNLTQENAIKFVLQYDDASEQTICFSNTFGEVWLKDGIAYKVMDPDSAKRILETVRTSAVAESPTATETLPVPVSLPEYRPGSVKLEPQDQDDYSFERKYRLAYYGIWGYFTECLTEEETADYMQWVDEYNKSTNYGETQEEMLLVTYIKRYNISRAEFDAAVEKMQAEMPPEDGVIYEESEVPNGDIIYTFDNEVINRYYRYA